MRVYSERHDRFFDPATAEWLEPACECDIACEYKRVADEPPPVTDRAEATYARLEFVEAEIERLETLLEGLE